MRLRKKEGPRWLVQLLESEPETRWFHRNVLRRRIRYRVVYAGEPEKFSLIRTLNLPSGAEVTLKVDDAFKRLQKTEGPTATR